MKANELKIAFLGVSHWHVPLYFPGLPAGAVIAVSDPNQTIAEKFAGQLGCRCYTDWKQLLDEAHPDFVFAFAPHYQMKDMALELIARGLPFAMEKPMGMNAAETEQIAAAAEKANAFCAVPFVWRYSDTVQMLKESILNTPIRHLSFKFVAGPPSRYLVSSPWMLSTATAGGGCMTNLGVHFMDMALYLTDAKNADVLSAIYQYGSEYDVELYASAMLRLDTGASLLLETGYAYPMSEGVQRENRWTIVTDNGYYILAENQLEAREYGKDVRRIPLNTDSDVYYPKFAAATLDDYVNGRTPRASLREMLTVRHILDRTNEEGARKV